jgi:amidohydrolase
MPIIPEIADLADELTRIRRDIHAHPELGFEEQRTSDIVAAKLAEYGCEVHRGLATTGVVGTIRRGNSLRAIGLRADMDCLPMQELNDFEHRSTHDGKMHACGHDGHTTMLLGAAKYLAATRNFDGTVHLIFQPGEEGFGGGRVMVEEGLFEKFPCDAVFAMHNKPGIPVGNMATTLGPMLAATDRFDIRVKAHGTHAAYPHIGTDPFVIGAQIVLALQTIVARRIDPIDSAVISITQFHAGSAGNVIPPDAALNGTVRTLKPVVQDEIERQMGEIVRSIATAHSAEAALEYSRGYPQVVNAPEPTRNAARAAAKIVGEDNIVRRTPPRMGGEDFSYMANVVPGCFVRIGQAGKTVGKTPVHHPEYDFNDEILPIGASFWATLVEQELARE